MGIYDTILVPTDGSAGVERAVAHAADLARVHDATIHALYVVDTPGVTGLPAETAVAGVRPPLQEQGEAALEAVERLVDGVPVETTVVEGTPSTEIVRFASERAVDAVVMGTHGRAGIDRLLLGSVTEQVVRSAPVPVVTVSVGEAAPDRAIGAATPGPT